MPEIDIFEDHDVISMTSYGHLTPSLTSPIDAPYGISYQVPIGQNPLDRFVSEIFCIKVAQKSAHTHKHTHTHTHTHTDTLSNKGRLKLAAREPTFWNTEPMQIIQQGRDVVVSAQIRRKTSCGINDGLKSINVTFRQTRQCDVAVVDLGLLNFSVLSSDF